MSNARQRERRALQPAAPRWRDAARRLDADPGDRAVAARELRLRLRASRGWTLYISLSNSSLLPTYSFVGLKPYYDLWSNAALEHRLRQSVLLQRLLCRAVARASASRWPSRIDQRVRGESDLAHDLSLSARRLVRRHRHGLELDLQPRRRHRIFSCAASAGRDFTFRLTTDRNLAIYAIIATGVWQSSGFAMALFLAGLRSVDPDLVKAAQIDGASRFRIYRKVILPIDRADLHRGRGGAAAIRHQDLRSRRRADQRRPGHLDDLPRQLRLRPHVPARPDRHRRGGAIMMLVALAVVLVPYALWMVWRAVAGGARAWLTSPSTPNMSPPVAREARRYVARPRRRLRVPERVRAHLSAAAVRRRRQFVPRTAGDHAERPDRACRAASR